MKRQLALTGGLLLAASIAVGCGSDDQDGADGPDPLESTEILPGYNETVCGEASVRRATGLEYTELWPHDGSPTVEVTLSVPAPAPKPSDDENLEVDCVQGPDGDVIVLHRTEYVDYVPHTWFGVADSKGTQVWSRHVIGELSTSGPELRVDRDGRPPLSFRLADGSPGNPPVRAVDDGYTLSDGAVLASTAGGGIMKTTKGMNVVVPGLRDVNETGLTSVRVDGGMVLLHGSHLTRLDTVEGTVVWSTTVASRQKFDTDHVEHDPGDIIAGDDIVIISGGGDPAIAVDLETGDELWELDREAIEGADAVERIVTYEQIAGGRVLLYVEGEDFRDPVTPILLDAETGKQLPTYGAPISGLTDDGYVAIVWNSADATSVREVLTTDDELKESASNYRP